MPRPLTAGCTQPLTKALEEDVPPGLDVYGQRQTQPLPLKPPRPGGLAFPRGLSAEGVGLARCRITRRCIAQDAGTLTMPRVPWFPCMRCTLLTSAFLALVPELVQIHLMMLCGSARSHSHSMREPPLSAFLRCRNQSPGANILRLSKPSCALSVMELLCGKGPTVSEPEDCGKAIVKKSEGHARQAAGSGAQTFTQPPSIVKCTPCPDAADGAPPLAAK